MTPIAAASAAPADVRTIAAADLRVLRESIGGEVLVPGDPGYEQGRFAHNIRFDRRPAVIVRPTGALGVSRAVLAARDLDLDIAVRGGGHSLAGHSTTDGGMLIDLRAMADVAIDPIRWTGTAQGGATAGAYTAASSRHGFVTPFGDSASVGLGGLTLGGGIGWLARKHGLTIDNLLAVDLVTADGELRTVTEASDPDLFWALRGGGGNFGIATRFTYRLHPVSMVTGGALVLPLTAEVVAGVIEASLEAPEELTQITMVMALPPAPFVPAELVGVPAVMVMPVHAGDLAAGEAAMAPFRALARPIADLVGPMPYPAMYELTAGASEDAPEVIRSSFLRGVDRSAAQALVERHQAPEGAMALSQLRVLGGAMSRVPAGATAFAHRDAPVLAAAITFATGSYEAAAAAAEDLLGAVATDPAGSYSNFTGEEPRRLGDVYPGATLERLVAVKRRVDPENVFHANHNIRP